MTHAWCSDPSRDAAVRAAEDNRTEPLPTLAEAIAAPFACTSCGGFGMDHRCRESCKECDGSGRAMFPKSGSASSAVDQENKGNGMRTERVTLEVTSAHDERLADCIVESIGDCLLHGESVRVVEEPLSDAWAQRLNRLTAERDAAIRERDEAKARVAELETRTSTPGEGSCAAPAAAVTQPWQKATLNQAVSIIVDGGDWGRGNDMDHGKLGAAVIWADKEIDRLSRELKEYAKQLAAYELEKRSASMRGVNCFATPAASGGGVSSLPSFSGNGKSALKETQAASGGGEGVAVALSISPAERDGLQVIVDGVIRHGNGFVVIPGSDSLRAVESLLARHTTAPPQPRGWLTEEERKALETVRIHISNADGLDEATERECKWVSDVCYRLLARSSPPEVDLPISLSPIDEELIRASLAAAGVAVKEVGRD